MTGKGLYRGAYRAAMALRAIRAWRWLRPDELLSVRVPGEEHPTVVIVAGAAGSEPGLTLVRGERAVEHAYRLLGGAAEDELASFDLIDLSFSRYEEVPLSRRRFLHRARIQPDGGSVVPSLIAKRPGEAPRELEDAEVDLARMVVRGLVEAIDLGLVGPRASQGEGSLGFVPLTISRRAEGHEIAVARDDAPPDRSLPPRLEIDRAALADLPRLRFSWIVGCPLMPFSVDEGDEVARMLVVIEKGTGRLLDGLTVSGPRWTYAAASRVIDLVAGHAGKPSPAGLPRSVLSSNAALAEILGPELRFVGVECRYEPAVELSVGDAADELAARIAEQAEE